MKLINMGLVADKLVYERNDLPEKEYKFNPKITRDVGKINETTYFVKISVKVENTKENEFPINLHVVLKGIFNFADISKEEEVMSFMKIQAVHIAYPYLRSMVTNLTNAALMPPIILPIINASSFFKD